MTKGVLSWPAMRSAINLNTGFFETSQYILANQMRVIAGNWDGAGQSAGNLQYNWGWADRLTELYNHLLNNHESVVQACFANRGRSDLYQGFKDINLTKTRLEKIAWGETITDYTKPAPDGHALIQPWKDILGDLMNTPECMDKYYEMMDTYYIPDALDLFKQLSCTSRASLASLFDLNINRGRFYPCNTIVVDFDEIDANPGLTDEEKEAQKVYQINVRGNDTTNAMDASASDFAPRRMAQANQGGDYFGSTYDPEAQFDINQEPAISEKSGGLGASVKLGEIPIQNVYLGDSLISKVYLGADLVGGETIEPYTTSKVPNSQFRTNSNNYAGFESGPITIDAGQKIWIDIQNFVACRTYYTTDGTDPTEASTLYHDGITLSQSCTLKVLNVSVSGVAEVIRSLVVTVNVPVPVTTISPSAVTQNAIPITVTLTSPYATTIYYKIGAGAQQTYTGPFTVNQNQVGSTSIPVTYWATNATGTEAQRTLTYITSGATPVKPVVSVTNLTNAVRLDWPVSQNALSYTVYRSTTPGSLGTAIASYISPNTYTDSTATGGTTYYYTVRAGNYGSPTDSDQVMGVPYTILVYENRMVDFETYADYLVYGTTEVTADFGNVATLQGDTRLKIDTTKRLRFEMPVDQFGSANTGGIIKAKIAGKDEYTLDYEIRFDNNFPWSKGGKIPGLSGGVGYTGGDPAWPGDGFSVRLMWREGGKIIPYVYHKNQPDIYGDHFDTLTNGIGNFTYTTAQTVKIYVKLNTGANLDGILRIWLDNVLLFEKTNICYRTDQSKIDTAHISIFAGGDDVAWAMTGASYIRLSHVHWQ